MNATPTKRRAPLGSLDLNIARSPRSPSSTNKLAKGLRGSVGSPLKKKTTTTRGATPTKRPFLSVLSADDKENAGVLLLPAAKKLCSDKVTVEDADEDEPVPASQASARRSTSPDATSLFDTPSVMNTSQLTNITEPDTEAPAVTFSPQRRPAPASSLLVDTLASLPPPRPRRVPTRDEFRQKAEILRLRLSLATYKVKTNQTDVPLDKLQILPVPGMARRRTPLPSMSAHTIERATPVQYWYRSSAAHNASSHAPIRRRHHHPAEDAGKVEEDEVHIISKREGAAEEEEEEDGDLEAALPKLLPPSDAAPMTPRRSRSEADEETLTSSALRGGAAKGLLSLSQGSH